jgi:transcriptional regulator with XRE-family HTH domain
MIAKIKHKQTSEYSVCNITEVNSMNKPQSNLVYTKGYGKNYANLRKKEFNSTQDFTVRELSKKLLISSSTISQIENEKREPTVEQVLAYKNFFGVSLDYLVGETTVINSDLSDICECTGLNEKAIDLLVSEKSNPSGITDLINLLMGEYADNKSLGGYADNSKKSVLKSIVDYLSVDPISVNSKTYYINKNGELRNAVPDSAEADFSSIVGLSNINIGEVIDSVLFDEIKKALKDIKSKQTK